MSELEYRTPTTRADVLPSRPPNMVECTTRCIFPGASAQSRRWLDCTERKFVYATGGHCDLVRGRHAAAAAQGLGGFCSKQYSSSVNAV